VPLAALTLGVPLMARFGDAVGDIGRGADCTLVLPDPERTISRKQALITCRGGQHYICPIGSNFTVELDGRPLSPNVECALEVGSELRIGPYVLVVEDVSEAPPTVRPPATPTPEVRPTGRSADDPLAAFGQRKGGARASVFSDLLSATTSADASPPAPPSQPAPAGPSPQSPGSAARAPALHEPRSVDFDVGEATASGARKGTKRTRSTAAPHALQGVQKARAAPTDSLVASLFSGLGIPVPEDRATAARQLRLIGELLRAAIGGTLELLAARTIAKRELGADATQLRTRANNPLKFSPDADAALAHLLGPQERGFISPMDALQDAFSDLRAHQVAMLTGMRAALDEVLARFDPAALEPLLVDDAIWNKLVPANRKAKLWEQYCQQYAGILREIDDDFDTLFGRAFLRAYQAQLAEFARADRLGRADESRGGK
jgi:type VI secretion system FHA domain protein